MSRSTGTTKKREAAKLASKFESEAVAERAASNEMPKAMAAVIETAGREAVVGSLTLARAEELVMRLHRLANPDYREMTLGEFWKAWIESQALHVSHSAAKGYREDMTMMSEALGDRVMSAPIRSLKTKQIETALRAATDSRRAATCNKALASLRRMLEQAVTRGLATTNPAKQVRPLDTGDSAERGAFTAPEVKAMLDHPTTSDEWRGAILIAAHTGLRLGDVIRLNRNHVEGRRLVIRASKTKKSRKTLQVPLTSAVLSWIGDREGDLFPRLIGRKTGTLSTQFRRIMERAGVARDIVEAGDVVKRRSFHSLRHTFVSWLAEADVQADVRQRLTGHASAGIHARYTHHDEALDRAVGTLPDLVSIG